MAYIMHHEDTNNTVDTPNGNNTKGYISPSLHEPSKQQTASTELVGLNNYPPAQFNPKLKPPSKRPHYESVINLPTPTANATNLTPKNTPINSFPAAENMSGPPFPKPQVPSNENEH